MHPIPALASTLMVWLAITSCTSKPGSNPPSIEPDSVIARLSAAYRNRIGDLITNGISAEARFLAPDRIVYLEKKQAPFVHLFRTDGQPLWTGVSSGGGPKELDAPHAVAVSNDTINIVQAGRLSRWRVAADTIAFIDAIPLGANYSPLGIVAGCAGQLLFYGWDRRQFVDSATTASTVSPISTLSVTGLRARLEPWWTAPSNLIGTPYRNHSGVLIGRTANNIALHFRSHPSDAGEVLSFDCDGNVRFRYSERSMVTGEGVPAHAPRKKALQWTAGAIAYQNGVAVAVHRYFHPKWHVATEPHWKTEIFFLEDGRYAGSILIRGQWSLLDFDARHGILMGTNEPVPHFIVAEFDLLRDGTT